jgi:Immunoglobulin I-set domain/NHL repeat
MSTLFSYGAQRALAAAIIALSLAACGGGGNAAGTNNPGGGTTNPPPPPPSVVAPAISQHPQSQTVNDGQRASFAVTATGTSPLAYQWRRNGVDIAGATQSTYDIEVTSLADDTAQYSVVVSNSAGSVTSNASALTIVAIAPGVATQPLAQTVLAGASATFSVIARGSQPLQYQWRMNGVAIAGANSYSYTTNASGLGDSGALFDVMVSNTVGSVVSAGALLTVSQVTLAPEIIDQPASASAQVGGAVAFAVVASGTAPLHYEWKRNDVVVPNQNDSKLIVSPVSGPNHQDFYTVTVSNSAGSAVSAAAILSVTSQAGQIDLVAGLHGGSGNVDGSGGNAHFNYPLDVAVDSSGNLFIADSGNDVVRKMTPAGVVTTIAGTAGEKGYVDASGPSARFTSVHSIAVDSDGNVFVGDGYSIRRIAMNGTVTTLAGKPDESGYADGIGAAARFNMAGGELAAAPNGDVYVGDCENDVIRRVTPAGTVSTYAGTPNQSGSADGPVSSSTFNCPKALGFDTLGTLYVSDHDNHTIRKITAGNVTTLAGTPTPLGNDVDGTGSAASFGDVHDLAVASTGIISVLDGRVVRRVTAAGVVTTVAGSCCSYSYDGVGTAAGFFAIEGMAVDAAGYLYIADQTVHAIRKVAPDYAVSTLPLRLGTHGYGGNRDGDAATALFGGLIGITADTNGTMYVVDAMNNAIRKIDGTNVTTIATSLWGPKGISIAPDGNLYVPTIPFGVVVARVTPAGQVTALAGSHNNRGFADGIGEAALFRDITGVAADGNGNIYVADSRNNAIRKINIATRAVSTLAGNPQQPAGSADGVGAAARFNEPCGIEADSSGNIYVAECESHTIRKVTPTGVVTTIAGTADVAGYIDGAGAGALFSAPADVALDDNGNLYVAEQGNWLIRKITPQGIVSTVAGSKGLRGQVLGSLPGSLDVPIGLHARSLGGGNVELLVTIENAVIRITTQ